MPSKHVVVQFEIWKKAVINKLVEGFCFIICYEQAQRDKRLPSLKPFVPNPWPFTIQKTGRSANPKAAMPSPTCSTSNQPTPTGAEWLYGCMMVVSSLTWDNASLPPRWLVLVGAGKGLSEINISNIAGAWEEELKPLWECNGPNWISAKFPRWVDV